MSMQSVVHTITAFALFTATVHGAHAEELVGSIPGQLSVQQGACWGWGLDCQDFPPLPAVAKPSPRMA